ncbi:hypothetical protein [Vulcanisaeta souniana]|uniref:Uncharacterized protein n=1 Tax=Vulcanisaeta souniana JCM 11219 TaxID=1293586 RepID=A0A830E2V3_9CREN|nr:hypothetical protein [Vulcanisaeta souniana]BDR93459.1 hypothetical protein Vsou_25520 [Vulcanisaeta souniana JCM 11219]GGI77274.1 hypothetical protein GCM10007112_12620 [Vulcanisaeta souniana JCM 11219]
MPGINDVVQDEMKKIVSKYLEQVNEKISKTREELLKKVEEIKNIK